MSESFNQITEMDMINLRKGLIKLVLLLSFISADGASTKRTGLPSEIYQTPTTKEDVDSLKLVLQNKEEVVDCVDIDLHGDYCLALKLSGILSERPSIKVYLNQNIVRNCSSSGICTDHGALYKNTRLQEASEGCEGIPFANIHENLTGEYIVISNTTTKRLKASFNLTFCKGGKSDDEESLKVNLEYKGKPTDCVSQSRPNYDGFCLQLRFGDQPVKNKAFRCFLHNQLIYDCSANGSCTAHGILQGNTRPSYTVENCSGIPFANVVPTAMGQYACEVEDETRLIEDEFHLHFCNGSPPIYNKTEAKVEEHLEKNSTSNSHITTPVVIAPSIIALVVLLGCRVYILC
ncbi:uncharacterized protein [Palaemon carinicauda]|uniref:uncharacterized protein n=1 Tax=Palaemon carinicauda TaxID=392227 RepID=UPI0035B58993